MNNEPGEHPALRPAPDALASGAAMIEQYQRDGYVFLDGAFAPAEVETLRAAARAAADHRGERRVLESDGATVRSVYGIHQHERGFADLARHPRLVELARALLGGDVYVYQSKLNAKAALGGDLWPWHQDYIFWRNEDAMPAPRALTAAVFLDDVTELNGPIALVPGSHHAGVLPYDTAAGAPPGYDAAPAWIANLVARLKYTIRHDALLGLARTNGVITPKARAGSVLVFDCNTAHASAVNLSPYARTIALVTYNRVDNAPDARTLRRPEFLVSRDVRPIVPVADDVLRPPARAPA
jgi:ectoine hydroxylase